MSAKTSTVRDGRKPGWFYVENGVIDHYGAEVGAIGVAVYVALARFANGNGQAFPAYQTIANNLKIARNTVISAIRRLEEAGLITIDPQTDDAGNPIATNVYTLCAIVDRNEQKTRKGGAGNEPPSAADEPPHAADEPPHAAVAPPDAAVAPPDAAVGRGGAADAYEHDSSNMIVDGVGVGRTAAFLIDKGIGASDEFADLPYEPMRADYEARCADGQSKGNIVRAWRRNPPTESYHYEPKQRSIGQHAPDQRLPSERIRERPVLPPGLKLSGRLDAD